MSLKKILIVDDEEDVADLVSYQLKQIGYETLTETESMNALSAMREFDPDLLILDVMMPELNGIQVCRLVRSDREFSSIPIIFLSARGDVEDKVKGLESGADDYVSKPFDARELALRVQSILSRKSVENKAIENTGARIEEGNIIIDEDLHEVFVCGDLVELTITEFKLLKILIERKGRVQSRENLLINVWNYDTDIETRTIDTHIRRLREKLAGESDRIETVRGVGYRFKK